MNLKEKKRKLILTVCEYNKVCDEVLKENLVVDIVIYLL